MLLLLLLAVTTAAANYGVAPAVPLSQQVNLVLPVTSNCAMDRVDFRGLTSFGDIIH